MELTIEQEVSYGLDYAFEFALTNPFVTPPAADNVWRFETLQNGVILHLQPPVEQTLVVRSPEAQRARLRLGTDQGLRT